METATQACYRHPDRRAGVICQRCDRPICPDCMRQASVGFHCPDCAKVGAQRVIRPGQVVTRPAATLVLVAANVAIFAADAAAPASLIREGGLAGPLVAAGEWWRIVSSAFLHVNIVHVGFNAFLLYQLGLLLEPALGRARFCVVYATAVFGGALGALALSPDALTVGASGGVFGLMGAAVAAMRSRGIDVFSTGIGGLLALNLLITFLVPGISIGGHLGGLAAGFVAGWVLVELGPRALRSDATATAVAVALAAALFAGGLAIA